MLGNWDAGLFGKIRTAICLCLICLIIKIWLQSGNMVYATMQQMALSLLWVRGHLTFYGLSSAWGKARGSRGLPLGLVFCRGGK